VVTEFTYQAYPHPNPVYSGLLVFTPDKLEALVGAFNIWLAESGENPKTSCFIAVGQPPPVFAPMFIVVIFHDGSEEEGRGIFKPFFDLGPVVDMTASRPYVEQVHPNQW